ncbi:MAG: tRNA (adenosine(37)-N6)-dimethylallyltransferase MiaA [Gemmatimonadales bacterium]|nr:MAG: tRNA (adenosine(37)-N6)-dimethylallyltransferase MiaA [Gemmatimonadales bacterium]
MSGSPDALALVGPTGSGKTALSIPLARRLDGEIISMDSRQVYRGMDIGTDKVDPEARGQVQHWGLDLVEPGERFSAARWARLARGWIAEIRSRGRVPILVGGTGFYLRSLQEPVFQEPPRDDHRRRELERWLDRLPLHELVRWAERLDPERADLAAAGGRQRLIRTLEVAILTGRSLSWWHRHAPPAWPAVRVSVVLLEMPREVLYRRINERAREMFDGGLLDEVKALLDGGAQPEDPGMTGTGYREAAAVLSGRMEVDEAVDAVQRATRRYARRQITWFRHQLAETGVLRLDATLPLDEQLERVDRWVQLEPIRQEGG